MKLICSSPFLSLLLIPSLVVSPLAAQSPLPATAPTTSQVAVPGAQSSTVDNTDLQLRVVESAGTDAKVNSTPAKGLTVAVTNASGVPVPDAAVALRLPDSGPTGTFPDGSHAAVAYTDPAGQAQFAGLHWNQTPGSVAMRVTATKANSHAALLLNKTLTSDSATLVQVPPPPPQTAPAPPQPGQTAKTQAPAGSGANPAVTITSTRPVVTAPAAAKLEPAVSVTGASPDSTQHSGKTKWIILAAVVAAAAGAGVAVMGKGKSSSTPAASGLTIGTPSVSVGSPH